MTNVAPELLNVIENLDLAQKRLGDVVSRVGPERWQEASPNPGWSYKDLLAHLTTGDWVCQHVLHGLLESGNLPDFPDVDAGNAERIAARRDKSVNELMAERSEHRRQTIELIKRLQPVHLEQTIVSRFGEAPILRYLQGFPVHDIQHTREIEAIANK